MKKQMSVMLVAVICAVSAQVVCAKEDAMTAAKATTQIALPNEQEASLQLQLQDMNPFEEAVPSFNAMESTFKKGVAPSEADLTGEFPGRRYYPESKTDAYSSIFVGERRDDLRMSSGSENDKFYMDVFADKKPGTNMFSTYINKGGPISGYRASLDNLIKASVAQAPLCSAVKFSAKSASNAKGGEKMEVRKYNSFLLVRFQEEGVVSYGYYNTAKH